MGRKLILSLFLFFLLLAGMIAWNRNQVYPNSEELKNLKSFYGKDFYLTDKASVLHAINLTIDTIKHSYLDNTSAIDIIQVIRKKKGLCYDRSLLLQKLLLANNFKIRPVFVFWGKKNTFFYNFFNALDSHNIFEVYIDDQWLVVEVIQKISDLNLTTIEDYIKSGFYVPSHSRYIRHLNNRNGRFISPSWLPDIY